MIVADVEVVHVQLDVRTGPLILARTPGADVGVALSKWRDKKRTIRGGSRLSVTGEGICHLPVALPVTFRVPALSNGVGPEAGHAAAWGHTALGQLRKAAAAEVTGEAVISFLVAATCAGNGHRLAPELIVTGW